MKEEEKEYLANLRIKRTGLLTQIKGLNRVLTEGTMTIKVGHRTNRTLDGEGAVLPLSNKQIRLRVQALDGARDSLRTVNSKIDNFVDRTMEIKYL